MHLYAVRIFTDGIDEDLYYRVAESEEAVKESLIEEQFTNGDYDTREEAKERVEDFLDTITCVDDEVDGYKITLTKI